MEIKDKAILKVTWFDGKMDTFIYDIKTNLFITTGYMLSVDKITTEEELAYYIEHLDDRFKNLDIESTTIKYYELIND